MVGTYSIYASWVNNSTIHLFAHQVRTPYISLASRPYQLQVTSHLEHQLSFNPTAVLQF